MTDIKKVFIKGGALYDATTGNAMVIGFLTEAHIEAYVNDHEHLVLPVLDHDGQPWMSEGQLVFCPGGTHYETVNRRLTDVSPCPDCGGMVIWINEPTMDSTEGKCVGCGNGVGLGSILSENS